ncbi:class I SAM-dependent methyltransferase [Candidatus Pelagibacter sp.]|nr:class I SAM-dependent methyltransferase [Candidatus Pelagibacter sp.]
MIKKIGNPDIKNQKIINKIKNTNINFFYIKNQKDFRDKILENIKIHDDVLDIGKAMRDRFDLINAKSIETLDVNEFEDYPDILFDICDEIEDSLINKYDKIICLAILEHVYNPFKAVENLKKMLKPNGIIYGHVPYLFYYHAPNNLKFQDYFRFSKDALIYLFKDFNEIELFPIRGRISTPLNILFAGRWKKYIEKTGINIFLDKFTSDEKNLKQCSGFNFIVKK